MKSKKIVAVLIALYIIYSFTQTVSEQKIISVNSLYSPELNITSGQKIDVGDIVISEVFIEKGGFL